MELNNLLHCQMNDCSIPAHNHPWADKQSTPSLESNNWEGEFWRLVEAQGTGAHIQFCREVKELIGRVEAKAREEGRVSILAEMKVDLEEPYKDKIRQEERTRINKLIDEMKKVEAAYFPDGEDTGLRSSMNIGWNQALEALKNKLK